MICPVCKIRWAPYPMGDFSFSEDDHTKIISIEKDAVERREAIWDNDNLVACRECSL